MYIFARHVFSTYGSALLHVIVRCDMCLSRRIKHLLLASVLKTKPAWKSLELSSPHVFSAGNPVGDDVELNQLSNALLPRFVTTSNLTGSRQIKL